MRKLLHWELRWQISLSLPLGRGSLKTKAAWMTDNNNLIRITIWVTLRMAIHTATHLPSNTVEQHESTCTRYASCVCVFQNRSPGQMFWRANAPAASGNAGKAANHHLSSLIWRDKDCPIEWRLIHWEFGGPPEDRLPSSSELAL